MGKTLAALAVLAALTSPPEFRLFQSTVIARAGSVVEARHLPPSWLNSPSVRGPLMSRSRIAALVVLALVPTVFADKPAKFDPVWKGSVEDADLAKDAPAVLV